ncbi:MAG: hypothetical protein CFE46_17205 [Burkholderiales bacterium PBB6]|nr:MAG: hypothetical protein CFE46_17205 [Burkholderiales bacterium PBB6]
MRWPWQRAAARHDTLVFSLGAGTLDWLLGDTRTQPPTVRRWGSEPLAEDGALPDAELLRSLSHSAGTATAVLPLSGYQLLQIEAPAVPPDELRAAARWHIRERVDVHVDDLTLDVLRVGRPQAPTVGQGQLFVIAAPTTRVVQLNATAESARWPLQVIDVTDLAQRNLHTAAAGAADLADRATACLMQHGSSSLITICVGDELYYSRRLDWDAELLDRAAAARAKSTSAATDANEPAFAASGLEGAELGASGSFTFSLDDIGLPPAIELGADTEDAGSRLVVELQRSFDVWERSWPDLPLGVLWLHHTGDTDATSQYLQELLGMRVMPLNLQQLYTPATAGDDAASTPLPEPQVPLLGALLRHVRLEP